MADEAQSTARTLHGWFEERPRWLQTAAARYLRSGKPSSVEVEELADLCFSEATGSATAAYEVISPGSLGDASPTAGFKIVSLDEIEGVNAIRNGVSLLLGERNLTVVYGANGSGKSGFARLLKHMCGARLKTDLLPNVYSESSPVPGAKVTIDASGGRSVLAWKLGGGPLDALRCVQVFDSQTGSAYVNQRTQASFEPRRMALLSALVEICDQVGLVIAARKNQFVSAMPEIPDGFADTEAGRFLSSISAKTKVAQVDAACKIKPEEAAERVTIEASLAQSDVAGRLKLISGQLRALQGILAEIEAVRSKLGDEKVCTISEARARATARRRAANEYAEKVFSRAEVVGVGQESWRIFWEKAREYSEKTAFPGQTFPVVAVGTPCLLCHRPLDEDTASRLANFDEFIRGGLERDAVEAEADLTKELATLPASPIGNEWNSRLSALGVESEVVGSCIKAANKRLTEVLTAVDPSVISGVDWKSLLELVSNRISAIEGEERTLQTLQIEGKRDELTKRLVELKAKEWAEQQKAAVNTEIARLAALSRLAAAERLVKTNALTTKKNELAADELAKDYQRRFAAELKALSRGRVAVTTEPVPEGKGRVSFQVVLTGTKKPATAASVLSEGENRVAALAAFLADTAVAESNAPFIFDDPVSSLDQDFEELVVSRLVALAKTRQVIVFTHRLSLATLIEEAVERWKKDAEAKNLKPIVASNLVCLRRLEGQVGITAELAIREKNPLAGFRRIRDDVVPKIRSAAEAGNVEDFDAKLEAACTDFRILLERSVEKVLINEIVLRFRRAVQTMNRIGALAKITQADCDVIDGLMTRYSCFEHSQSDDLPIVLPTMDEFTEDLEAIIDWLTSFSRRSAKREELVGEADAQAGG